MDFLTGSHLLDFPDNILIQQILPKIPFAELDRACLSSPNVSRLCKREELWAAKVKYDYPQFLNQKPSDMKWVRYYVYLNDRRSIPVEVNGLSIGNIMFSFKVFDLTMKDLLNSYTDFKQPYYIMFTDDDNKPYILIREPDNKLRTLSEKYDEITKIVISQS